MPRGGVSTLSPTVTLETRLQNQPAIAVRWQLAVEIIRTLSLQPSRVHFYYVLSFHPPGRAYLNVGVLVYSEDRQNVQWRLRDDWSDIASEEDEEVLSETGNSFLAYLGDLKAEGFLTFLEENLSNFIRLDGPHAAPPGPTDMVVEELFNKYVL